METFGHSIMRTIPRLGPTPMLSHDPYRDHRAWSISAAVAEVGLDGDWVEFGVWQGDTARLLLDYLPAESELVLLDSFDGLPEDWLPGFPAGTFAVDVPPAFSDERVRIVRGLFADTADAALRGRDLALIHIDCDLYSSTVDALRSVGRLRAGTVILFDEYVHRIGGVTDDGEHRALTEWAADTGHTFAYLWRTDHTQVAIRIE